MYIIIIIIIASHPIPYSILIPPQCGGIESICSGIAFLGSPYTWAEMAYLYLFI